MFLGIPGCTRHSALTGFGYCRMYDWRANALFHLTLPICLKGLDILCRFPQFFTKGTTFVTSCLLSCTQLSSALSSAYDFKSHFCKQCGPRSDCSSRSSLIRVHTVCLYAKTGLKSMQEFSAEDILNRRHFQMQVFFAF